jgi:MFS family permease
MLYVVAFFVILFLRKSLLPRDMVRKEGAAPIRIFTKPDRYIALLGLIVFGSMICEGSMFDWSSIYFEEVIKPSKELVRLGYIAFMSTMATGRFAADKLVNRFGVVRMIRASGIVIATGLMLAVVFPNLLMATLGFLLVGLGTSSVVPLCYSLAGKSKTMMPGIALATVSTIGFGGFLLGPPVIGFIAQISSMRWSFAVIAAIGLATTFLAPKLKMYLAESNAKPLPNLDAQKRA